MCETEQWLPATKRGQEWKNSKFHLLLYFSYMVFVFEEAKNYDSQCSEHNYKYLAKKLVYRFCRNFFIRL